MIIGIYGDNLIFVESWISIKISKVRGILRRLKYRDAQISFPAGETVRKDIFIYLDLIKQSLDDFITSRFKKFSFYKNNLIV